MSSIYSKFLFLSVTSLSISSNIFINFEGRFHDRSHRDHKDSRAMEREKEKREIILVSRDNEISR